MINTLTWDDIYKKWQFVLGCYQENMSFPCSNSYFMEITPTSTEETTYDFIAWWNKDSFGDDYRKLNWSDFLTRNDRMYRTMMGYRDKPKYYDTAEILYNYRDNAEETVLLWLYTLCLYYSANNYKLLLPYEQSEEFLRVLAVESRYRNHPRTNPGRSKYFLPVSIRDARHYSDVLNIKSTDDLIVTLYYDVCFILAQYQLVHVVTK